MLNHLLKKLKTKKRDKKWYVYTKVNLNCLKIGLGIIYKGFSFALKKYHDLLFSMSLSRLFFP